VTPFELDDLPSWASDLLEQARVARLALLDDRDRPRALPITFALHAKCVYSAIDRKPKSVAAREVARLRYLKRRPEVAVIVDTYDEDWSALAWVQLLGRAEVVEVDGEEAALAALAEKYPQYRKTPPDGPLIEITPERGICWRARG
jgi:PPOX class probable F420-dependent enzyme